MVDVLLDASCAEREGRRGGVKKINDRRALETVGRRLAGQKDSRGQVRNEGQWACGVPERTWSRVSAWRLAPGTLFAT